MVLEIQLLNWKSICNLYWKMKFLEKQNIEYYTYSYCFNKMFFYWFNKIFSFLGSIITKLFYSHWRGVVLDLENNLLMHLFKVFHDKSWKSSIVLKYKLQLILVLYNKTEKTFKTLGWKISIKAIQAGVVDIIWFPLIVLTSRSIIIL